MPYLPTVYVVDDDADFVRWSARWLRGAGYGVETFPDGERFLRSRWKSEAACLIVDLRLGTADGDAMDERPRVDDRATSQWEFSSRNGDGSARSGASSTALARGAAGGISGLDLLNRVRRHCPTLPTIFTGTMASIRLVCSLFHEGAFDFLEKPVSERELKRSVSFAVSRKNRRRVGDRDRPVEPRLAHRLETLTPREFEVLGEMLRGMSIKQLATRFDISIQTAAKHRARVLNKLDCENEMHVLHLLGRRWSQIFSDIVV